MGLPVSVDFLIGYNNYSLFDKTEEFENSKVVLVGDIHGVTTAQKTDISTRLLLQTGGILLLENIPDDYIFPSPNGAKFMGAEDGDLHRQAIDVQKDLKRLVREMSSEEGWKIYPEFKHQVEEFRRLDHRREDGFVLRIKEAVPQTEGKVYFSVGIDHIISDYIRSTLKSESISYWACVPSDKSGEQTSILELLADKLQTTENIYSAIMKQREIES